MRLNEISYDDLNSQQKEIHDLVLNTKQNILVSAMAGTGKSALVHVLYKTFIKEGYTPICVAFTGKAALNMPGNRSTTCSRNVGMKIGIDMYLPGDLREARGYSKNNARQPASTIVGSVDSRWGDQNLIVFVDEIGQLSSENANLFLWLGLEFRKRKLKDKYTEPTFVFTGDIGQFKPVNGTLITESCKIPYWATVEDLTYLELPSILDTLNVQVKTLTKVVRQSDSTYLRALRWAYYGIALHPLFIKRLDYEPSNPNATKYMFNNAEVVKENDEYVDNYIKANPDKHVREYRAIISGRLSTGDANLLLPVQEIMRVAEGMTFCITENVGTGRELIVANGEKVKVIELKNKSIIVENSKGYTHEIGYVKHSLPTTKGRFSTEFMQLPGYVGKSETIYRIQGETFNDERIFGAWQWLFTHRRSLKNHSGAVYVMVSRNTSIEQLFFDTSIGKELALDLLKDSIKVDDYTLDYLLNHKEPLWITDVNKARIVLELDRVDTSPDLDPPCDCHIFEFTLTNIVQDQEIRYELFVDPISGNPELLYNLTTNEAYSDLSSFGFIKQMTQLVKVWFKDWKGQHNISQIYSDFDHLIHPIKKSLIETTK